MRACFYDESPEWRGKIWDRALWSIERLQASVAHSG